MLSAFHPFIQPAALQDAPNDARRLLGGRKRLEEHASAMTARTLANLDDPCPNAATRSSSSPFLAPGAAMINERDAILEVVRRLASNRPVRWVDKNTSAGDFDGREWTVEVFDVAKSDRLTLREKLWDLFSAVRKHTGKPMSLVTHTPEDTTSFYAWLA